MTDYEYLLELSEKLMGSQGERDHVLTAVCFLLKDEVEHYDWVGIYIADEKQRKLRLGPYAGEPTEHTVIEYGRGICGQVAESHETFEVPDVRAQGNYLACSPFVKSEIVVPIMKRGKLSAQLDIDSHEADSFTDVDRRFLEALCEKLASFF